MTHYLLPSILRFYVFFLDTDQVLSAILHINISIAIIYIYFAHVIFNENTEKNSLLVSLYWIDLKLNMSKKKLTYYTL